MASLFTVLVAGVHYLIHSQKLGTIKETINPDSIIPVTVLTTEEIFENLEATLQLFDVYDDVFIPEFGSVLVEKPPANNTRQPDQTLEDSIEQLIYHIDYEEDGVRLADLSDLPSGPYILHGPNLYQAWRLYEDDLDAFTFGVVPENVNKLNRFRPLNALTPDGAHNAIPVPSRLYQKPPNPDRPLSNVRVTIPDTMSLKGVHTTLSSKAWSSLHPTASTSTAQLAQKLIDLGAVIVGKTKTSQFDVGQDWVDATAPWNPRADGYQTPHGPSAGAASALAGYGWLQHSIGQDSLEGVRQLAAAQGLYALRSSQGAVPLNGSIVSSSSYDAIGLSARLLDQLLNLAKKTLPSIDQGIKPSRLLYPVDLAAASSKEYKELMKEFITAMENYAGIKTQPINITDLWNGSPPDEADGQAMQDFMKDAFFESLCYEFYHEYDDFRTSYLEEFQKAPFVEATPRIRWTVGKSVSAEKYEEHVARLDVFRRWFDSNVMPVSLTDEPAVMILPYNQAKAKYRDRPQKKPSAHEGITLEALAPILGVPQFVAPFAQLPYHSKISEIEEYLPVSASLLGPKSSDIALIQLVKQAFQLAQWRTRVDTGRFVFPPADNSRNVDDSRIE